MRRGSSRPQVLRSSRPPVAWMTLARALPPGRGLRSIKWLNRSVVGTGLPIWGLAGLITFSALLFLLWGGPLWESSRGASHVGRFAVSYLAVVPAAAALLSLRRTFSGGHLAATCGLAWAAKMVVTSLLYYAVAPGTAATLQPREAPSAPAPAPPISRYHPAGGDFARGALEGTVQRHGHPAQATLFAVKPPPGLPLPAPRARELVVLGSAYAAPLTVVSLHDTLTAHNADRTLHTLRLSSDGRLEATRPLPPNAGAVPVPLPHPGLYRLSCANHRTEAGWLLVLDHPYVARTDADGRFRMDAVPAGPLALAAISLQPDGLWRVDSTVDASAARTLLLDLETGHPMAALAQPEEVTR